MEFRAQAIAAIIRPFHRYRPKQFPRLPPLKCGHVFRSAGARLRACAFFLRHPKGDFHAHQMARPTTVSDLENLQQKGFVEFRHARRGWLAGLPLGALTGLLGSP